jgi:hypothetical protein
MASYIGRRKFLATLGGAAAWPLAAGAQQPPLPVVGFIHSASPHVVEDRLRAFLQDLKETGYIEGQNVAIEYRWAEEQNDRLPVLAADVLPEAQFQFHPRHRAGRERHPKRQREAARARSNHGDAQINAGLADPKMQARLADLGAVLAGSPADFGKIIAPRSSRTPASRRTDPRSQPTFHN